MEREAARQLLGLDATYGVEEVQAQAHAKRAQIASRLASAPTESLRKKYQAALEEVLLAASVLTATPGSRAPHLSQTKLADLPGAAPELTRFGASATDASRGAAAPQRQAGTVLAGRYELRERVGSGGMGEVFRAFDRNRHEDIAIKVLLPHLLRHPVARERFLAEAKISITLAHPNIVNVFDVQRDGETDFLTMELLQGQTLRQHMEARKAAMQRFGVKEAVAITTAVGNALDYAHKKTVHRDVKPENIWVTQEDGATAPSYKLMDFGIARLMSNSQMNQTATAMGTAYYMAPEQLHAAKDIDGRADQYALGVLMYELITGELPVGRVKPLRERDPSVPRHVSAAVDRALSGRPHERFPTMGAFVQALNAPVAGMGKAQLMLAAGGAAALLVALVVFWPTVRSLIPDRAMDAELRSKAIQAQGVSESLLKRVESSERDIDASLREAKSQVDRLEGSARSARTESERDDLAQRMAVARRTLTSWEEIKTLTNTVVFGGEAIGQLRGQINVGAAALREGKVKVAAETLAGTQAAAEALLALPTQISDSVTAKGQLETAMADLKGIGAQEKVAVDAELNSGALAMDKGSAMLNVGKYADAKAEFGQGLQAVHERINSLVDEMVPRYSALAERATTAGDYGTAEVALGRAKRLAALRTNK